MIRSKGREERKKEKQRRRMTKGKKKCRFPSCTTLSALVGVSMTGTWLL